jgi:hypothetical protein
VTNQDRTHRTWSNRDTKPAQFTDDAPLAPGWVLAREPNDQRRCVAIDGWPSRCPMRARPAARHQPLMPAQQCPRADREDRPPVSRQNATKRRQQQPVRLAQPRSPRLAAQDRQLVAQHQDLQLLSPPRPTKEHHQLEQTPNDQVRKRQEHARPPEGGNRRTLPNRQLSTPRPRVTEFSNPTRAPSPPPRAEATLFPGIAAARRSSGRRANPARVGREDRRPTSTITRARKDAKRPVTAVTTKIATPPGPCRPRRQPF